MNIVAPQNLPSWFRLMFHYEYHIALHSYIVMGLKYFGYQVFLKLWRLIALTSCSSRTLSSKPLDLSSSKVFAYLKMIYPSLWIIRGLKFVIDYKKNHSFDSLVKLGFLLGSRLLINVHILVWKLQHLIGIWKVFVQEIGQDAQRIWNFGDDSLVS